MDVKRWLPDMSSTVASLTVLSTRSTTCLSLSSGEKWRSNSAEPSSDRCSVLNSCSLFDTTFRLSWKSSSKTKTTVSIAQPRLEDDVPRPGISPAFLIAGSTGDLFLSATPPKPSEFCEEARLASESCPRVTTPFVMKGRHSSNF